MRKRRNPWMIAHDILALSFRPSNKTRLVYMANLNFRSFDEHANDLMDLDLITLDGQMYKTTDKGKRTIRLLRELFDIFGIRYQKLESLPEA